MTPGFVAVPFYLPAVYGGFGEGDGVAQVDKAGLTLQFEVRDSVIGALKSGVKEVPIPLG